MRQASLKDTQLPLVKELYQDSSKTLPAVAHELGCGLATLKRFLKKHGLKQRQAAAQELTPVSTATLDEGVHVWLCYTSASTLVN